MKLMVIGSGGREHALAWKLLRSKDVSEVLLAPGNAGAALEENIRCVDIPGNHYEKLVSFAQKEKVDFVVVGPDQALADGLVDKMEEKNIASFGPSATASRLESSKIFAKNLMGKLNIPTARFSSFSDPSMAKKFLENSPWGKSWALKADGLALGKGVLVTEELGEALECIDEFMVKQSMGGAGKQVVIEERLTGRELSAFYICDGVEARFLNFACDYKQIYDGGKGANTGGMGAYSPPDGIPSSIEKQIHLNIVQPLLKEMEEMGSPFSGVLFLGLILTQEGVKVLEFNVRFGDPEAQTILPLLGCDLLPLLLAANRGKLSQVPSFSYKNKTAVHLVLAAKGYPGTLGTSIRKGDPIVISPELFHESTDHKLFFAGVSGSSKNDLKTAGGRVLGLTVLGESREEARKLAYEKIKGISFLGSQMRTDIAEVVEYGK